MVSVVYGGVAVFGRKRDMVTTHQYTYIIMSPISYHLNKLHIHTDIVSLQFPLI